MTSLRHLFWIAALLGGMPLAATGELFRCEGPDGRIIFTDQKSACPGADPFEPSGELHRAPTPSDAPAAPAPHRAQPASRAAAEEAMARHWQEKKRAAEAELEKLDRRREWLRPYVGHCNRGGYVTTRDEAGIKQVVNCTVLRSELDALEGKEQAARAYLDQGLREECRRAGCLPGWIR